MHYRAYLKTAKSLTKKKKPLNKKKKKSKVCKPQSPPHSPIVSTPVNFATAPTRAPVPYVTKVLPLAPVPYVTKVLPLAPVTGNSSVFIDYKSKQPFDCELTKVRFYPAFGQVFFLLTICFHLNRWTLRKMKTNS